MSSVAVANRRAEEVFVKTRAPIRISAPIASRARTLWPVKTAAQLAEITGFSQRACEAWLADDAKIPADALAALIRSTAGLYFLVAIMGAAKPPWWFWFLRASAVASAMRRRADDRKLIERAMGADHELATTMARAAAALSVQDEEFARPWADALGAMAGLGDCPMAAAPTPKPRRR
jgi:hypothetical protein